MSAILGYAAFLAAPLVLGGWLLWADPRCRRIRIKSIGFYLLVMGLLIGGAMYLVASIAQAEVVPFEVAIVLWFTIAARLTWAVWTRTVGRWGQRWVRWGRLCRFRGAGIAAGGAFHSAVPRALDGVGVLPRVSSHVGYTSLQVP